MKKILAIVLVAVIAFAVLPSISAPPVEIIPGAPMFEDCSTNYLPIGTFFLAPGQQGEIASFDIPAKICPSVKKIQMGGFATTQGLPIGLLTQLNTETDSSVLDRGGYSYTCYYTGPCDECLGPGCGRTIMINVNESLGPSNCLQVEFYTIQGISNTIYINYYGLWANLPSDIVRIVIKSNGCEVGGTLEGSIGVHDCCCYECIKEKNLPTTLYPKIDIETFSVPGGATVIKDGKVISKFEMSPGSQQVFLQVENRGFFTQNDTRLRFDGLPEGVTVEVTPETQKVKAHKIASYSANFTVGPNVPSGTYQITMVAYSPNGMFDKITFEFVVQ